MRISDRARDELRRRFLLAGEHDLGIALYVACDAELVAGEDETFVATLEHPGWQLKLIPTGHLPEDALLVANTIRVFPYRQPSEQLLDFDGNGFTLDACIVHTTEP